VRPAFAADAAAVEEIRAAIAGGRTAKAVKRIERELSGVAPGTTAELQYLMFKAHVVDLGPGASAELDKQIAGKDEHGMEIYEASKGFGEDSRPRRDRLRGDLLEGLVSEVRRQVLGDPTDRLVRLPLLVVPLEELVHHLLERLGFDPSDLRVPTFRHVPQPGGQDDARLVLRHRAEVLPDAFPCSSGRVSVVNVPAPPLLLMVIRTRNMGHFTRPGAGNSAR
jgi:hypothetical protein